MKFLPAYEICWQQGRKWSNKEEFNLLWDEYYKKYKDELDSLLKPENKILTIDAFSYTLSRLAKMDNSEENMILIGTYYRELYDKYRNDTMW